MKLSKKDAKKILFRFYGTDGFCSTYLENEAIQTLGYKSSMRIIRAIIKRIISA